jgi:orotidine-5'-phosphate decarboxylase
MEFVESILASLNGVVLDWKAPDIPTVADMSTDPGVLSWSVLGSHNRT